MEAAGYNKDPTRFFAADCRCHKGFPYHGAVPLKFLGRRVRARKITPPGDVTNELFDLRTLQRRRFEGEARFEKMVPQIVVVAASGTASQRLQIFAPPKVASNRR